MDNHKKIPLDAIKLWIFLFAAGILLVFFRIGHESIWFDESYSAVLIRHSIPQIWTIAGGDSHPPLYFILLRLYSLIFGSSLPALRSFSAIAVILLALLGPFSVRRALGIRTALLYTFAVFTLPILVSFAQEIRMYTLAAYFVTGAAVYGFLAARDEKKSDWIKFVLFSLAGCYTHYFALLGITIYTAVLFLWMIRFKKSQWKIFLLAGGIIAAGYLPWVSSLLGQIGRVSHDFWIDPLAYDDLWWILVSPFLAKFNWFFFGVFSLYLSMALIAWGFGRAIYKKYQDYQFPLMVLCAYILTITAGVAVSILIRPVMISRYIVPIVGLFIIPVAYGLSKLDRHALIKWVAALYLLLCIPMIILIHRDRNNGPMDEAAAYLNTKISKDTIFLHTSEHTLGTFSYHFPDNKQILYFYPGFRGYSGYAAFAPKGEVCYGENLDNLLKNQTNIWLVTRLGTKEDKTTGSWLMSGRAEAVGRAVYFSLRSSWFALSAMPIRWHSGVPEFTPSGREDWPSDLHKNGSIKIKLKGFQNDDGVAECALFYEKCPKPMSDPRNAWLRKAVPIKNGMAELSFNNLPYGSYSILAYQDTNEMSTNTNFQIDYGSDNWGLSGIFDKPTFDKTRLVLEKPQMEVIIPIVYLWKKEL